MLQTNQYNDDNHFTLENIPFGVISTRSQPELRRIATRIYGDAYVIADLIKHDLVKGLSEAAIHALNQSNHVLNASNAIFGVRSMPPGFLHYPIGYTGRSSSIVPSGTSIKRPLGLRRDDDKAIIFGPCQQLDLELEIGVVIGRPTEHGSPTLVEDAEEHVFGLLLINDWSARDIQALEMNPLGPLNGKSFGTSISPWIVTLEALQPFACQPCVRDQNVVVSKYLEGAKDSNHYDIQVQADIITPTSTSRDPTRLHSDPMLSPHSTTTTICNSNLQNIYWPISALVAHQTVNGCPLPPGDLLGTGMISGPTPESLACMMEMTEGGKKPSILSDGQKRIYLEDGDGIRITGWAGKLGTESCVGFGECYGWIESAPNLTSQ